MHSFRAEHWVDLTQTEHAVLFADTTAAWEVLPKLPEYIEQLVKVTDIHWSVKIHSSAVIGHGVKIGANTVIGPHVVIEDHVIIGERCELRKGAYIRPNALIGNDCVIGHCSEVKQSLLLNNVVAPHFNYIGDSVVGYHAHLGGGAVIANFKSTGSTVAVVADSDRIDTGLRKFGAIIGDYAEIGGGAILNPGTCVGRRTLIYPGAVVRGVIPENKIYKIKSIGVELVDRLAH